MLRLAHTIIACLGVVALLTGAPASAQMRSTAGAPGPDYWQQQVDYDLEVSLERTAHRLWGDGWMHYHNRSPHTLSVIWLQLDQNRFLPGSASVRAMDPAQDTVTYLAGVNPGIRNLRITDARGAPLAVSIDGTYARVTLPHALAPGDSIRLGLAWSLNLLDRQRVRARSGYEALPGGGSIHLAAQWYPRAAVFHDDGWQLRPFLGQGEFSLEFGDFRVAVSVPAQCLVAATGVLVNPQDVLSSAELGRLRAAHGGTRSRISSPGQRAGTGSKRWQFVAENVRDFAFAVSDRFYWEAAAVTVDGRQIRAQVFYPEQGKHLWQPYGVDAIAHSLREYSQRVFPYPWPTATMVNIAGLGMEYPMLGVNGERGTDDVARWDMIGGIIHEVGHNWFPMMVNSNERLYAWMDEGIVAFLEHHIEKAWDAAFLIIYGEPDNLERYRGQPYQQPLMTPADDLTHRIDNAYDYAAAVLNILRSEVLGPALFDRALREYATAWRFKRATAEDFFRAMEAGSGRDLSAFWEEWFYSVQSPRDRGGDPHSTATGSALNEH